MEDSSTFEIGEGDGLGSNESVIEVDEETISASATIPWERMPIELNACTRAPKLHQRYRRQNPLNPQLMEEEKAACSAYAEALVKEEQIIRQKARVNWLQEGDRCTKFYYTQFAARKAHNTLNTVILPDGTKIEDQRQVQHYIIEYYKDLPNKESDQPIPPFSSSTRKWLKGDIKLVCFNVGTAAQQQ
ncbi:hypothetical protein QJS10_CPB22g00284 [Acorus calamus]|uniref:Uncharacterized protein n=1 Tax=Acorus calamus TaxID=4465 RepID=A0AAV9C0E5_ACOCL|nr:hypothetical protein QJS10_CPB22g00284 [Acorus calamus]